MKLIKEINDLNKAIKFNYNLGFIPTMGGLHNGHKSLIKISKKKCKKTIVSIFVNPKQFNRIEDFKKYPRNINKDLKILKKLKVDFVYLPTINQVYKGKKPLKIKLKKSQKILCAKYRRGHFEGVLDVMNCLIKAIMPKFVFMGEKDFQQLFLVKKFIERNYNTKVFKCRTIRSNNKMALSTRNFLLNKADIITAGFIAKNLINLKSKITRNKKNSKQLIKETRNALIKKFNIKIEYLETRNINNLNTSIINKSFKVFVAYYINNIRLIDNF